MIPSVSIAPGGWYGFYSLGVMMHMKSSYDLSNVVIGGSSAGAHVSIYALSQRDDHHIMTRAIDPLINLLVDSSLRRDYEKRVRRVYESADLALDFSRGFTTVTTLRVRRPFVQNRLERGFLTESEMIDSVIRSSFVPGLFGSLGIVRDGHMDIDGAVTVSKDSLPASCTRVLHVHQGMFGRKTSDLGGMWQFEPGRAMDLVCLGYEDAQKHLDSVLRNTDEALLILKKT